MQRFHPLYAKGVKFTATLINATSYPNMYSDHNMLHKYIITDIILCVK